MKTPQEQPNQASPEEEQQAEIQGLYDLAGNSPETAGFALGRLQRLQDRYTRYSQTPSDKSTSYDARKIQAYADLAALAAGVSEDVRALFPREEA